MSTNKDMDFWIEHDLNVLFKGKHGVGKTARIIEAFERKGVKWKYFSASTIDPWVDFVGIPKESIDPNTGKSVISFVRPPDIENDEVEAIFFDEFNRAPKKVLNAVMELIQFKTINGKPLKNLRMIWAAVNLNDEDNDDAKYHVEQIDPAQLDRFHIHVDVPYALDKPYFSSKYGKNEFEAAKEWWKGLPEKIRDLVSPRRLDYALNVWKSGGNISYVLPKESNPTTLIARLSNGPFEERLEKAINGTMKWSEVFADANFEQWIGQNLDKTNVMSNINHIIDHLNKDTISSIVNKNIGNKSLMTSILGTKTGASICSEILKANTAPRKVIRALNALVNITSGTSTGTSGIAMTKKQVEAAFPLIYKMLDTTQKRDFVATQTIKDMRTILLPNFINARAGGIGAPNTPMSWAGIPGVTDVSLITDAIAKLYIVRIRTHKNPYSGLTANKSGTTKLAREISAYLMTNGLTLAPEVSAMLTALI